MTLRTSLAIRLEAELFLGPLDDASDVALAVHRAGERVLDLEEPEQHAAVRIHDVDEPRPPSSIGSATRS